jgi:hypothetical protein
VYGNGGRCIEAFVVTNFWIVNNTCYKNNLDATLGNAASLTTNNSKNGYFINNIAVAWDTANPTYSEEGTNATISDYGNLYYGSPLNFSPNASAQFVQADPLFVNPPVLTGGQYATALAPAARFNGANDEPGNRRGNRPHDAAEPTRRNRQRSEDVRLYGHQWEGAAAGREFRFGGVPTLESERAARTSSIVFTCS